MCPAGKSRSSADEVRSPRIAAAAEASARCGGAEDEADGRHPAELGTLPGAARRPEELQRAPASSGTPGDPPHESAESTAASEGALSASSSSRRPTDDFEAGAVPDGGAPRAAWADCGAEPEGAEFSEDEDDEGDDGQPTRRSRKRQRRRRRHGRAKVSADQAAEVGPEADGAPADWARIPGCCPETHLPAPAAKRSVVTLGDLGLGNLAPAAAPATPIGMCPMSAMATQPASCAAAAGWVLADQRPQSWHGQVAEVYSTVPISPSRSPSNRAPPPQLFSTSPLAAGRCSFSQMALCSPAGAREPLQPAQPAQPPAPPAQLAQRPELRGWLLASGLQMSTSELEAHLKAVALDTYED